MNETELKILFPDEKLNALRFFLGKKELTVEHELRDYLDKTYEKAVPQQVREYVENREEHESEQHESADTSTPSAQQERQSRQSRRHQREPVSAEPSAVQSQSPEELGPDEEENQGMSMSM